ncbi:esterase E4-like [Fopius arisanus]|uniref:Carboxylic ester hydrolase n=1 Tax=Fopius arisanus TaxID=64838 RepID=A0A9R1U8C6_9HYME|nr:PREDICTED: esterase E4-like [Fopius arisanus]
MKGIYLFLLFVSISGAFAHKKDGDERVEVELSLGKIKGSIITSRLKRKIYSFRGVRFAEPPTGELRFKPTVPVRPWNGTFDASEEGPGCPQPGLDLQSEDCLRLNVYTTKFPSKNEDVKRPVIVFFHPGGFYSWSGQTYYAGPHYIMDQDIVLVTVSYRLGSLGFLSTGDALAPGNNGLKDQVEALRWVKKHISKFGGDPNSVTISGCSAGSWSNSVHLVSPMSRGLFHRVIGVSGAATYQNPLPHHQKDLAKRQAEVLGCPSDTTERILNCLKTKTAEEFGNSLPKLAEWYGDPVLQWRPVIEPEVPGVERFLSAQPSDLIRQGKLCHVPLMTGITKDEFGGVLTIPITQQKVNGSTAIFDDINANYTRIFPISFFYERGTDRSLAITKSLRKFYLEDKPVGVDNWQGLADLYADALVGFANHRFVNLMGAHSRAPVWYWKFTYQGRFTTARWPDGKPFGVVHQDDLMYLFYQSKVFPYFEADAPENQMVDKMTAIWANFAKTGEPIPKDNPLFKNITWTKFTTDNQAYLDIGDSFEVKNGLYIDRMNEWEKLFPLRPLP